MSPMLLGDDPRAIAWARREFGRGFFWGAMSALSAVGVGGILHLLFFS